LARDGEPEILTPQEAAEFLRVPLLTVQRQAKAGRLPGDGSVGNGGSLALCCWSGGVGADRHNLELYDREERKEHEERSNEEEPPGAEGQSQQG
jgi:hypothetical protein